MKPCLLVYGSLRLQYHILGTLNDQVCGYYDNDIITTLGVDSIGNGGSDSG